MPHNRLQIEVVRQVVGDFVIVELSDQLAGDLEPLAGLTFVYERNSDAAAVYDRRLVVVNERDMVRRIDVSQMPAREQWLQGFLTAARELRQEEGER